MQASEKKYLIKPEIHQKVEHLQQWKAKTEPHNIAANWAIAYLDQAASNQNIMNLEDLINDLYDLVTLYNKSKQRYIATISPESDAADQIKKLFTLPHTHASIARIRTELNK